MDQTRNGLGDAASDAPTTVAVDVLRRLAVLPIDLAVDSLATLGVLHVVEESPRHPSAVFAALHPLAPHLANAGVCVNVPFLHRLVDEGLLETCAAGPSCQHRGRQYSLTLAGRGALVELRNRVRVAGQRALARTAADLDMLVLPALLSVA